MTARPPALGAFAHATIGVANLDEATAFWVEHFGFEIAARQDGPDKHLAALWRIGAANITRQAMVRTPMASAGAMHLVEFARPGQPVRQNAQIFDYLPKNLDIYVRDMPARFEQLKSRGLRFRSDPVTSSGPDGIVFREVHLSGHDNTNVVLIEIMGEGYNPGLNSKGFAGVGPLVTIVPELAREAAFYTGVLGMATTLDMRLSGSLIEKMIGLPAGNSLLMKVYGDPDEALGRVEVIQYEGSVGQNLFPLARAPNLGTLHVTYKVPDLQPLLHRLDAGKVEVCNHGRRELIYGTGQVVSFHSPAGFRIEVQETGAT